MKLRDYQEQAVASILEELNAGKSTLAVLPTGTGKTVIFGHVADAVHRQTGGRVLVIAHREELIFQARLKIDQVMGHPPEIEMGEFRASSRTLYNRSPVVVSSVQTQNSGSRCSCRNETDDTEGGIMAGCDRCIGGIIRRMQRFDPEEFSLVIVDEAHHATAGTYRRLLDYYGRNPNVRILGVTATPDRTDEAALGRIFDSVAMEYTLPDAIRDGWLVPIQQEFIQVDDLDFSGVRTTAGDLNGAELERIMTEEKNLHSVISPTLEIAGDRTVLFFAASVDHANLMADILNRHRPDSALCIHGETPSEYRRDMLRQFSRGRFQYLCGCGVFLEGFDEPRIDVIAMARPTKSRSLYAQAVGRGTRPILPPSGESPEDRRAEIAASRKPSVLVLDFVGNSGRHKLITTADILGGRYEDDVIELAIANAKRGERGPVDMQAELQNAEEEIRRRERAKREKLTAAARFSRSAVDPFDVFDLVPQREPGWHQGRTPTERQIAALGRFGVDLREVEKLTFTAASQLMTELVRRSKDGFCSYRQAKLLRKFGESADVTFAEASRKIEAVKRNGWRPLQRTSAAEVV